MRKTSDQAMSIISNLKAVLGTIISQESLNRDVIAKNVGLSVGSYSTSYNLNGLQQQVDNYVNSLSFLDDKDNNNSEEDTEDDLSKFDIADILPQDINRATASDIS